MINQCNMTFGNILIDLSGQVGQQWTTMTHQLTNAQDLAEIRHVLGWTMETSSTQFLALALAIF